MRERWLLQRNRVLSNPHFQRWSMRLPLLRGTARHHANAMFGVITGFVYTKTLTAAVDLGIIAALARAPESTAALAAAAGLEEAAMARLLAAAASIDLVEALPPALPEMAAGRWVSAARRWPATRARWR